MRKSFSFFFFSSSSVLTTLCTGTLWKGCYGSIAESVGIVGFGPVHLKHSKTKMRMNPKIERKRKLPVSQEFLVCTSTKNVQL